MKTAFPRLQFARQTLFGIVVTCLLAATASSAEAAASFLGVAAGDASSTGVTLWTRATPGGVVLAVEISTDPAFGTGVTRLNNACTTNAGSDFTCKRDVAGLTPNTVYYYRFIEQPAGAVSIVGRFKTAPQSTAAVPLHFAFSGDNDGLMRPYALASVLPAQNLDFYINLGDVIYENASNVAGNNGAAYLNSPSVALSNDSLSFNGVPRAFIPGGTPFATQAQLFADYSKKYSENFLPVNVGGQNALQVLYAAQGNYTTWDNHELGNRKYIDGGAPAGGSVGGAAGTDMSTGRGVDARLIGACNPGCANDVNNSTTDFMNRATGFLTLEQVFFNYQPIADRGTISAPTDPRTNGTRRLYNAQQWGKSAIYINTDSRSYRDIRIKTANAGADDSSAPRADNPNRTYLGATQFAWLKQTLLAAQNAGATWKFVSVSDPIDQLGPIGGVLAGTLTSVNTDSGKAYMGGYRAERNALLKFIADNHITNVVFLSTDDHQNRINEILYSPTGQTDMQSTYVKVPYCFSIVAGPLGATGPEVITDHSFGNIKAIADSLAAAQVAAGIEPVGLEGYPGVHNLVRAGDPTAGTSPQPVDFYSPDTFNFTVLDVSADGRTLTLKSVGMNATGQNVAREYADGPQASTVFSFKVDAAPTVESVTINDGGAQRSKVSAITVTLDGIVPQSSIAPGAFIVTRSEGGVFTAAVESVSVAGGKTLLTLAFSGPGVGADGSLPDGTYSLSVDRSKIPLDEPSPVTEIATFKTLFGDLDGDGSVGQSDIVASAHANGTRLGDADYIWYLDFDADGRIDGQDHREVVHRRNAAR